MNKVATTQKPEVLRFESELFGHGKKTVLEIPKNIRPKLYGMPKVEGTINGQPFRAAIEVRSDGALLLHVNAAMLRGAYAKIGEVVELALLGSEPDPTPPKDLQAEFDMSPEAVESWNKLTKMGQRDWVRWIEDAKKPETRARRIARTVEQLSEGKRRACCVDVNGFMMCRIKEDELQNKLT